MLGHITEWFYSHLVGIQSDLTIPGFKKIVIAPSPVIQTRESLFSEQTFLLVLVVVLETEHARTRRRTRTISFWLRPKDRTKDHLKWAEAKYESLHGSIFVRWERENKRFTLLVRIPANTTATVHVPASVESTIHESDQSAEKVAGVRLLQRKNHKAVFEIESGEYRFQRSVAR